MRRCWRGRLQGGTRELRAQLTARRDAQLAVDVAQVVLDGLRADEQSFCDLSIARSLAHGQRDLQLLRRKPVGTGKGARSQANPGGLQLVVSACSPTVSADCAERLPRRA